MKTKYVRTKYIRLIMIGALLTACNNTQITAYAEQAEISNENIVVSYLGPEGTYSQEACMNFFGDEGNYIPYTTVSETVDALLAGNRRVRASNQTESSWNSRNRFI